MKPYWSSPEGDVVLHLGDCLEILPSLPDCSVDAIVTDPPYGLEFMGREWDTFKPSAARIRERIDGRTNPADGKSVTMTPEAYVAGRPFQAWCQAWAAECLRMLKPGGHLLAFGGTRTWHRLACAIEDAGFEVRDSIHWIYGSGFPKSLDVSKAIDGAAGAKREVIGVSPFAARKPNGTWTGSTYGDEPTHGNGPVVTAPVTEDAARWAGWGTALKPAHEPIIVARKPLTGTVAANVLGYGTGALNIDGCRLGQGGYDAPGDRGQEDNRGRVLEVGMTPGHAHDGGRWPANVLLGHAEGCEPVGVRRVRTSDPRRADGTTNGRIATAHVYGGGRNETSPQAHPGYGAKDGLETVADWRFVPGCPVAELDRQSGVLTSGANPERRSSDKFRDAYGEFAGQETCTPYRGADTGGASRFFPVFRYEAKAPASERPRLPDGTAHPTVKPLDLMRWLARLVTPPGGTVLDLFAGTGTTAEACVIEGFRCVLIEQDPANAELVKVRLSKPIQPDLFGGAA